MATVMVTEVPVRREALYIKAGTKPLGFKNVMVQLLLSKAELLEVIDTFVTPGRVCRAVVRSVADANAEMDGVTVLSSRDSVNVPAKGGEATVR